METLVLDVSETLSGFWQWFSGENSWHRRRRLCLHHVCLTLRRFVSIYVEWGERTNRYEWVELGTSGGGNRMTGVGVLFECIFILYDFARFCGILKLANGQQGFSTGYQMLDYREFTHILHRLTIDTDTPARKCSKPWSSAYGLYGSVRVCLSDISGINTAHHRFGDRQNPL